MQTGMLVAVLLAGGLAAAWWLSGIFSWPADPDADVKRCAANANTIGKLVQVWESQCETIPKSIDASLDIDTAGAIHAVSGPLQSWARTLPQPCRAKLDPRSTAVAAYITERPLDVFACPVRLRNAGASALDATPEVHYRWRRTVVCLIHNPQR